MRVENQFRRIDPADASGWTLRQVFDSVFLKRRALAAASVAGYLSSIRRWEIITGNLVMREIADPQFDLDVFAEYVRSKIPVTRLDGKSESMSAASANKEIRQIQSVLSICGPRTKNNRDGQGFLPETPLLRLFAEPEPTPRFIPLVELDAIYAACRVAAWPREDYAGIPPDLWWQSAVVYLSNCGSRTVDWLALKTDDVDLSTGVVVLPREKKTGKRNKIPLAVCVVDHFRKIWSQRDLVWPAPKNKSYRNATWKLIQVKAGIPDPYRIKDLRSTCGDRWYAIDPAAARGVLNHSSQSTTDRHYARAAEHKFRRLAGIAESVEQPAAFLNDTPTLRIFG